MADVFAANGYRCGMFGKWHLGDNYPFAPQYRGFDETLCHRGGGVGELPDYTGNNYFDDMYFRNGRPQPCSGYCTDVFFDAALDFIDAHAQQPFFVYLATNAMHSPFVVPQHYARPYLEQGIPPRRANFYGMIANFDENMGRLLQRLAALGIADDTSVIFTSDHGTAAGYDPATGDGFNAGRRGIKGSVYDGGHRVPFFLRWTGSLPAGRSVSGTDGAHRCSADLGRAMRLAERYPLRRLQPRGANARRARSAASTVGRRAAAAGYAAQMASDRGAAWVLAVGWRRRALQYRQ